jgi:hypothetical protein
MVDVSSYMAAHHLLEGKVVYMFDHRIHLITNRHYFLFVFLGESRICLTEPEEQHFIFNAWRNRPVDFDFFRRAQLVSVLSNVLLLIPVLPYLLFMLRMDTIFSCEFLYNFKFTSDRVRAVLNSSHILVANTTSR